MTFLSSHFFPRSLCRRYKGTNRILYKKRSGVKRIWKIKLKNLKIFLKIIVKTKKNTLRSDKIYKTAPAANPIISKSRSSPPLKIHRHFHIIKTDSTQKQASSAAVINLPCFAAARTARNTSKSIAHAPPQSVIAISAYTPLCILLKQPSEQSGSLVASVYIFHHLYLAVNVKISRIGIELIYIKPLALYYKRSHICS